MKRANSYHVIYTIIFLALAICGTVLMGARYSAAARSDQEIRLDAVCSASFGAPTNFFVSNAPYSVTKSDFNGDGKLDLVTTSQLSNNVSVLLGMGTGSFAVAVNFSVASGPISVAVGDFNNDGKIDLVTANQFAQSVSILLGSGSGSFSAATSFTVGSPPRWVAVGDFNGDGKLDLATANQDDSVSILIGAGTGSFGTPTHFAAGSASGSSPFAVSVGDLNGDLKLDLAVANTSTANVSILLGTGTGSFSAPTNFSVGSNPRFIAIADFNGDNKPDLAVANTFANNISILLGSGTGTFGAATNFALGGSSSPWYIAVGDYNGDGLLDLATANGGANNVGILLGAGNGSFSAATNFPAAVNSFPDSVVAGDFNGDGKVDLATGNNGSSNVSILLNNAAACSSGPANDMIQTAQLLTGSAGLVSGNNTGATRQSTNFFTAFDQPVEPLHNGKYGGKSVWYQWTAPADGPVRFWIDPGSFDSLLAVYNVVTVAPIQGVTTTNVNLFPVMASNDDFDFNQSNKLLSLVSFRAKKDGIYYVAVDGVSGAGSFTLNWSQTSQTLSASGIGARISGLLDTGGSSLVAIQAGRTAPLTVVITGSGFVANSGVLVNDDVCRGDASNNCISGTVITTTFQNSARLTATVPPFYFGSTGDLVFTVRTGNQLAANRGVLHVSCIDVYQPQPGQTLNSTGPGQQCVKPPARYSLLSTNDTAQPLTFTVNILDVIDSASRALASSPNVGAINSAIGLNLLIANGMRAGYGLPPLSMPLALPGGQVLGNTAVNISVEPKSLLAGLVDLTYKPNVFLIGQDGTSLIGQDGTSIDRNKATIVAGGAGNIVATDGATIVATDGATIVAGGAGNIVSTDGATIVAGGAGNSPSRDADYYASTEVTSSSPNPIIPNDVNSPTSRTGWYVFPDAQGGNTNLKGVTQQDGSLGLEARIKVDTTTLPRVTNINKTAFAIVLNPSFINFSQSSYTVSEGAGSLTVTVRRTNNLTDSAIVGYSTTSRAEPEFAAPAGTASDRSDYASASGSLFFAPGETEKTFSIFITDDGLGGADDGASETFNILLNNAYGAAVDGTGSARVTITDNETVSATTNAVDNAQFFVRQHYVDFLNREPDQSGLQFWTNQIIECESRPLAERQGCREVRRVNVSAAFFLSIEFQETGFLVSRLHAASFGDFPASLSQRDFFLGTRFLGRDVVVGATGWEAKLEANKQAFLSFWITRPEFMATYAGKTNEDYVNTLFANAGVTVTQETTLRAQLITGLGNGTETRASALRKIAESATVSSRLFNPSFVLVQYMGYLRRQANETPDSNLDGYNFWLGKLNQFNGDYQAAEMVKAFITSGEYRGRFGKN